MPFAYVVRVIGGSESVAEVLVGLRIVVVLFVMIVVADDRKHRETHLSDVSFVIGVSVGIVPTDVAQRYTENMSFESLSVGQYARHDGIVELGHILGASYLYVGYGHEGERSEERRVGQECRSRWSPY